MVELEQRLTNREGEGEGEIERRMEDGGMQRGELEKIIRRRGFARRVATAVQPYAPPFSL